MRSTALVPGNAKEQELIRLIQTYDNLLMGLCIILLRDYHLAQDVVQEVFLRAWQKGNLHPETEKAWLIRIAVNLCRDQQRSRWRRYVDRSVTPDDLDSPVLPAENEVIYAVKELPRKEREVIVMHYWGNLSAEEIAGVLRMGRSSVYRRLDSARKKLKIELTESEWKGDPAP